jgi:hypothetical protein
MVEENPLEGKMLDKIKTIYVASPTKQKSHLGESTKEEFCGS